MKYIERVLFVINSSLGIAITIEDVKSVVGIVILGFQLILVVYNVIEKIIKHIKNKNPEKIPEEIEKGIDQLKDLKDGEHNE